MLGSYAGCAVELYMSDSGDPDKPDVDTCLWTDEEVCAARSRVERFFSVERGVLRTLVLS